MQRPVHISLATTLVTGTGPMTAATAMTTAMETAMAMMVGHALDILDFYQTRRLYVRLSWWYVSK